MGGELAVVERLGPPGRVVDFEESEPVALAR